MYRVMLGVLVAVAIVALPQMLLAKDKGHHGCKGHGELFKCLKEADKNNDGKWSKEEAPGRMKEHFEKIDANGDGQIDKKELKAAFKARMEQHRKRQGEGSQSK